MLVVLIMARKKRGGERTFAARAVTRAIHQAESRSALPELFTEFVLISSSNWHAGVIGYRVRKNLS